MTDKDDFAHRMFRAPYDALTEGEKRSVNRAIGYSNAPITCQCWNEGQWGRVHREDCPIHPINDE